MSGKYYPNNWQQYKETPDDFFVPHTFEELMIQILGVLPSNYVVGRSSLERCRVNRVTVIDDYQDGRSTYPTRNRWILQTDEGYKVISYSGNYRVGDSITIEVRQY